MASPRPTTSWSGRRSSFPPRVARAIRERDGQCMLHLSPACTGQPDEADHIVNHATAARLGWPQQDIDDMSNGQAACKPCHGLKTQAEQQAGRRAAQQQRRKRRRGRTEQRHPGLR